MSSTFPPGRSKPDPLVGSVINGKYRVVALVAAGGMGKIYRGEQLALARPVALKVLHAHAGAHSDDPQFKRRFFREASLLSKLQHPNIVTVFDYGAIEGTDERYFMAMEFLSGPTLAYRIAERVCLSARETVRIGKQIARGLCEAHAHGIVHRDLKPSNVMLVQGRDGEELVKLVDFGIVKLLGEDDAQDLTQEGSFVGSPRYMAPEQITRGGKIDPRTDVYALGVILYQCVTGTVPFDAESSIQTMMAHLNQAPQPIRERAPGAQLPDWLDALIMACIEKSPDRRPPSMEVVARALAEGEGTLGPSPASMRTSAAMFAPTGVATYGAHAQQATPDVSLDPTLASSPSGRGKKPPGAISGVTETGAIASLPPRGSSAETTAPRRASRLRSPILAASALVVLAGIGAVALRGSQRLASPATAAVGPTASAALPTARPAAPERKKTFTLLVESSPSGAEVREGDTLLGTTPLHLSIDNDAARLEPRRLMVRLDGYRPYSIVQGPSDESVRIAAQLAPIPAEEATRPLATPHAATKASAGNAPSAAPHPSAPKPDLDIRLNR